MSANTESEQNISADDIIEALGFGPAQAVIFTLIIAAMAVSYNDNNIYIFTAKDTNYKCLLDCKLKSTEYNKSLMVNDTNFVEEYPANCKKCLSDFHNDEEMKTCLADSLDKNSSEFYKACINEEDISIVTEFGLQNEHWKIALVGSSNGIGQLVGMIYIGYLTDKFGSKKIITVTVVLNVVLRLIQSFTSEYWSFVFIEFLCPALTSGCYGIAFILGVEMTTPKKRVISAAALTLLSNQSLTVLGLFAWLFPYWRYLLRYLYGPALVLVIYPMVSFDSIRWLILKGKSQEIISFINRSEKWNLKTKVNDKLAFLVEKLEKSDKNENKNITEINPLFEIIKSKKLCVRIILCCYCWITCALLYYGMHLISVTLSGNIYINFIVLSLADIPSTIVFHIMLSFIGRKTCLIISYVCCGVVCFVNYFIVFKSTLSILVIYLLTKFFISLAFHFIYIFTAELFPTSVRNTAVMFCSMVARVGMIAAPQATVFFKGTNTLLLLYGCFSAGASIVSFILPKNDSTLPL